MYKIISIILISYIGWKITGYDFFVLSALTSYSIDIYQGFTDLHKKISKNTKDETDNKLIQ